MGYQYGYQYYRKLTPEQASQIAVGDSYSFTYNGKEYSGTVNEIRFIGEGDVGVSVPGKFLGGAGFYAVGLSGNHDSFPNANLDIKFTRHRNTTGTSFWGTTMTVYKGWRFLTNGFWTGTILLQRYDKDESRWVTMKSYNSPNSAQSAKNYSDSGEFDEPTKIRITSADFETFVPKDNSENDRGYCELFADETEHAGWARITSIQSSQSVTADVGSPFANTNATSLWRLGSWNPRWGYPAAVGFYQERLCFGGSKKEPQTVWMSKTGDYYNFSVSHPSVDDDAISATITARQINGIQHFIGLDALVVLTGGAEWTLSADGAMTPSNIQAKAQSYRGSDVIEPVVIGNMVLFVQQHGRRVRDLGYTYESDSYTGNDLSVMANHLLEGYSIIDWCYAQEPHTCLWIVRSDGLLLSLTYLREQNVVAWARHPTNGAVCSVASVPGEHGDDIYLCVNRGGNLCIEIMQPWKKPEKAGDISYLDSCVEVSGEAVKEIAGMEHLAGKIIRVLADGSCVGGSECPPSGKVYLKRACRHAFAGLNYQSKLRTLDVNTQRSDGTQVTRKARVVSVGIRVENSRGIYAGVDEEHLEEFIDRTTEPFGEATNLFTGDVKLRLDSGYESYGAGSVFVETKEPLPASIQTIVPEISLGG